MKSKRILLMYCFILVLVGSLLVYSFNIEPYRLKTLEYTLSNNKDHQDMLKVVQFSDVHIKQNYTKKHLDKVVNLINEQNADVVVFTGDLYDNYSIYNDDENIVASLSRINAGVEKLAIWGNRDYGGGAENHFPKIMEDSGFNLLKNDNYILEYNNKEILFTGLDDGLLGDIVMPEIEGSYDMKILLAHEPDVVDHYNSIDYDLVLSGHSHGGQINIPGLSLINKYALSYTDLASKYGAGLYTLEDNAAKRLYVNTGLGTTHISARFNVVPNIAVFHIYL